MKSGTPPLVAVVAMSHPERAIGNKNSLLWHLPSDLKHFKTLTVGYPIIMGRKTFESILSILGKPLPNRTTIVVTRDTAYQYDGVLVEHSLEAAIARAEVLEPEEIHIGGGAELYKQALPLLSRLHVTWVFDSPEADTFFPEFESEFELTAESTEQFENNIRFMWTDYIRKES